MLSDIVPAKEEAKEDIKGALIGLLIVIGAIIILNTVNTDLTKLNLNIATTTVNQSPTIGEVIAALQKRIETIEARALADQAAVRIQNCPTYTFLGGGDRDRCKQECNLTQGVFSANWSIDTCTFSEADAMGCNPNSDSMCCESVHGGSWAEDTKVCSGVAEAKIARKLQCGRDKRVWDEPGNYCRTATCDVNTNENCCAATGGIIQNALCSISNPDQGTTFQDKAFCQSQGNLWTEPNGPCVPNNNKTIVPGSAFPIPPYATDLNPNVPSELNQINAACQGGGIDYEYSPELNQCVIYQ